MKWVAYGLIAIFAAAAVGVALLPLGLALSIAEAPIEGEASGTVWKGRIENAVVADRLIGEVRVSADPISLFRGGIAGEVSVDGPLGTGTGRAGVGGGLVTLRGIDAVVAVGAFGFDDPFGQPLGGTLELTGDAVFGPAGCKAADLTARTDMMSEMAGRFGEDGFDLAGPATCEDGVLVADLEGQGGLGSGRALVRLRPGRYVSELTLNPADPQASRALTAYGFRRTPGGYTVVTRGTY